MKLRRVKRPFTNKLCLDSPPGAGGWMEHEARRGCIRHRDHEGPHRNKRCEWDEGQTELARARKDKS